MYRTEKDGNKITIWDDGKGVGLRFTEGETLQAYQSQVIIQNPATLATAEGVEALTRVQEEITCYATQHYPKEFAQI